MKTIFFDVMIGGRFYRTMRYRYCPAFPLNIAELEEYVLQKMPSLRGRKFEIAL